MCLFNDSFNSFLRKKIVFVCILLFILFISNIFCDEYYNNDFDYYLDLPAYWDVIDNANSACVGFSNPDSNIVFQVYVFGNDIFNSSSEIYVYIKNSLNASGKGEEFKYTGNIAIYADLNFNTGSYNSRGNFVFLKTDKYSFALMCFTQLDYYDDSFDLILSALNSFSLGSINKYTPGPVSQYNYPFPPEREEEIILNINNKNYTSNIDLDAVANTQFFIEIESNILVFWNERDDYIPAWNRYYRMIYKENYSRFKDIAGIISNALELENKTDLEISVSLASWLQSFEYNRTGTITDLTSPLESVLSMSGDCDSRSLLFTILSHYFNIDSILLVSVTYSHSGAGIYLDIPGAKISSNNKDYVFTELIGKVDIGQIDSEMNSLNEWIPIKLGK